MTADSAELRAVADRLYGLTPREFTAARTAAEKQARSDGDRELAAAVKALRRPTLAAWAVNLLVRERRDLVSQVVELGASLREAQASLEGAALRELTRQRRQLVAAVTAEARSVAAEHGESLSEQAGRQVEETLHAAMTDPSGADAVLTGLLTQPLSTTGLETVSDLLAVPGARGPAASARSSAPSGAGPTGLRLVPEPDASEQDRTARREAEREAARQEAEERLEQAESAVAATGATVESLQKKHRKRQARVLQLENELEELRRRVAELEDATEKAVERLTDVESRVEEAETELADAQAEVGSAREALDALDAPG